MGVEGKKWNVNIKMDLGENEGNCGLGSMN
jgi:hypothetical protein